MKADDITQAIDRLVASVVPRATRRKMYGGVMFELEAGNPETRFCGYFVHAGHVGVEFAKGALLSDPDGILQGKGRLRRHLRLRAVEDIAANRLETFVAQAMLI